MRTLVFLVLFSLTASGYAAGMGYDEARHLLNRTAFAASETEVQAFAKLGRQQAVDALLAGARPVASTAPPAWVNEAFIPLARMRDMSDEERQALRKDLQAKSVDLRGWWYQEMLSTPSPLTERMTLFWHNHFVSSQQKVRSPQLMYQQNALLRRYALGNFGELLHAVAKDPAMILYLDNVANRKGKPNENFARELMELFTLGEGHYGEQDVKEAARAFTGWSMDRATGQYRFYQRAHDGGVKTLLGKTGAFNGGDVLDLLLAQPQTAELIATKLWREFVSPSPDPAEIKRLAGIFRASRYDTGALLRALLTSDAFYAQANRGTLVKSPVVFIIGTLRQFDLRPADWRPFLLAARGLGQDVFAPPNVKGWPGGDTWINSHTLLIRKQLLERLFGVPSSAQAQAALATAPLGAQDEQSPPAVEKPWRRKLAAPNGVRVNTEQWLNQFSATGTDHRARIGKLLLATTPAQAPSAATDGEFVRRLVLDPAYQVY